MLTALPLISSTGSDIFVSDVGCADSVMVMTVPVVLSVIVFITSPVISSVTVVVSIFDLAESVFSANSSTESSIFCCGVGVSFADLEMVASFSTSGFASGVLTLSFICVDVGVEVVTAFSTESSIFCCGVGVTFADLEMITSFFASGVLTLSFICADVGVEVATAKLSVGILDVGSADCSGNLLLVSAEPFCSSGNIEDSKFAQCLSGLKPASAPKILTADVIERTKGIFDPLAVGINVNSRGFTDFNSSLFCNNSSNVSGGSVLICLLKLYSNPPLKASAGKSLLSFSR
ncbi:MAG: hypothetical protein V4612_00270 [Pseudomonadota bacterium]